MSPIFRNIKQGCQRYAGNYPFLPKKASHIFAASCASIRAGLLP